MVLDIQAWNPTLLASLAAPSGIDYAGRLSQLDLNSAQRQKVLAELAYLPAQRQAELQHQKVYALQQGYIMNPDGSFTMTPAKAQQMALDQQIGSALGSLGLGGTSQQNSNASAGMPAWMMTASGEEQAPQFADNGDLTQSTDGQMMGAPSIAPAPQQGNSQQLLSLLSLAGGASGNSPLVSAAGNLMQQDIQQQKINQGTPEYKGRQALTKKVNENAVTDINERMTKANDAVLSLQNNIEAKNLLDSGVITGTGANYLVSFGKALNQAGINLAEDEIANSEAFVGLRAAEVGRQIKQFGSGTGLSDADREYATQAAAGKISLNEKSIRKIISISDRASKNIIKLYNKKASNYYDVPEMKKAFPPIEEPVYQKTEPKNPSTEPVSYEEYFK